MWQVFQIFLEAVELPHVADVRRTERLRTGNFLLQVVAYLLVGVGPEPHLWEKPIEFLIDPEVESQYPGIHAYGCLQLALPEVLRHPVDEIEAFFFC